MLQLLLKTHLTFFLIPLITLAIEPTDPGALCERFLGDKDKATCMLKVSKSELDWYASTACGLQQEDESFMSCLDEIKGASFNPEALDLCSRPNELNDTSRLSCIKKIKNKDYSRAQLKKCAEVKETLAIETCLYNNSRSPASAPNGSGKGFQALEIKK
ncbi:hypothetical protein [Bdellovibrio sp. HCB337]|uniref:hypothetical protein n=1 Tax=Bdellovibrio sp. HCB337 TaxID=3394358 RepID=UPI0039A6E45C